MRILKLVLLTTLLNPSAFARGDALNAEQVRVANDIVWAADFVGVPRSLLLALCWGEGWGYRVAKRRSPTHLDGRTYSHGICQVKLETAQYMDRVNRLKVPATAVRLEDDRVNAYYAARYLRYQLKRYHWDWRLAVDAYNKHNAVGVATEYLRRFDRSLAYLRDALPSQTLASNGGME